VFLWSRDDTKCFGLEGCRFEKAADRSDYYLYGYRVVTYVVGGLGSILSLIHMQVCISFSTFPVLFFPIVHCLDG
jgi:hypothetical protein